MSYGLHQQRVHDKHAYTKNHQVDSIIITELYLGPEFMPCNLPETGCTRDPKLTSTMGTKSQLRPSSINVGGLCCLVHVFTVFAGLGSDRIGL
jgi:hypothetical protein